MDIRKVLADIDQKLEKRFSLMDDFPEEMIASLWMACRDAEIDWKIKMQATRDYMEGTQEWTDQEYMQSYLKYIGSAALAGRIAERFPDVIESRSIE